MMTWIRARARLLAISILGSLFIAGAASAVTNQLPVIQGPSGPLSAAPVALIGYDSGTGAPCVVGKTVTCILSTTGGGGGGGGGAITAAASSYAAGAYVAGSIVDGANITEGLKADLCAVYTNSCSIDGRLAAIEKAAEDTTTANPVKAALATFVDGWDATQGLTTDGACAGDTTSGCTVEARLQRLIQRLTTINTTLNAPFQAGGTIGNLPSAVDTNTGAAGASTIRTVPANGSTMAATSTITSPVLTPTITAGAYATGNVIGGILSFTSQPTTGALANVNVTFDSGTFTGTVDFYVFNASPTGGGTSDHAPFALTATDTAKMIGVFHLSDCTSLGGILSQCQALYQSQFYTLASSGTTIFGVPVIRGAITPAGTGDMKISLDVVK